MAVRGCVEDEEVEFEEEGEADGCVVLAFFVLGCNLPALPAPRFELCNNNLKEPEQTKEPSSHRIL